jgi:hypothetical protein
VVDGGAGVFGTSPWDYYLRHLLSANGPFILLAGAGLVVSARRAPWLVAAVASYVVVHSLVGHKELRFVLPVVPLALGLAGAGLGQILDAALGSGAAEADGARPGVMRVAWARPAVLALTALLASSFAYSAGRETLGRLGEPRPELARDSPWHHVESWNRLLSAAGRQASACGVIVVPLNIVFTGGYSYLHRNIPLWNDNWEAIRNGAQPPQSANELIAPVDYPVPAGFREVAREADTHLLVRKGGCDRPPPGFSSAIPPPPAPTQRP